MANGNDLQGALDRAGGITKALLNALDQIQQYAAASQIGPDGKPSGTAVYMHMPMGYPIDPKMFANPWTPGGGDSAASFSNEGTLVQPAGSPPATATDGKGPTGAVYPPPKPAPDKQLEASLQNAMFTSALVDNMLEVTQNGVAAAWPERRVSVEYFTVLQGMQPVATAGPAQSVLDEVAKAQALLYIRDDKGTLVGYTPVYANYKKYRTAWAAAVANQALNYARSMSDPIYGAAYPATAQVDADKVKQALDDLVGLGQKQQVEDALDTLKTVGEDAVKALVAEAHDWYGAYSMQLGGVVSINVPWSYISPISWWDHTDQSFGVQQLTATTSSYDAGGGSGASNYANNWWKEQSQSTSASVGVNVGFVSASANVSVADATNSFATQNGRASWSNYADKASDCQINFEYFVATIERPWLLGDLFNIEGWYLVGQKKNSISDGTIVTQVGDHSKLLPMIPKAFVIMRNVEITADDWGDAGSAFDQAQTNTTGSGQSSSQSFGGSVGYMCIGASAEHSFQQASGDFSTSGSANSGWSFTRSGNGGTLKLLGSQIIGWIGEIQPAAPKMDDPSIGQAATHG